MTAPTVLTRHGDWCRLQTSTAHVHENTCKAATLLSSSEMYCSFRTRERCADCLLANILKAQTTHTYPTTLHYQHFIWVDFSSMKPLQKKHFNYDPESNAHTDLLACQAVGGLCKGLEIKTLRITNGRSDLHCCFVFFLAHLLALFGSRLESSPANACCNSPLEKGCVKLSTSLVLCTSGSPLSFSGPAALTSSFDTSLRLLLSEGVDGFSCFAGAVRPDVWVLLFPELQPAVFADTALVTESDLGFLLASCCCCCCFCSELLLFPNMHMS